MIMALDFDPDFDFARLSKPNGARASRPVPVKGAF
jgi:hypothetical protein